jgi:hypothetical protein
MKMCVLCMRRNMTEMVMHQNHCPKGPQGPSHLSLGTRATSTEAISIIKEPVKSEMGAQTDCIGTHLKPIAFGAVAEIA